MAAQPAVIIGAGVIALSTALTVLNKHPGLPILLIAGELPSDDPSRWTPDYASMWAGAHYRPIAPDNATQRDEAELALQTSTTMRWIARHQPGAGVAIVPAVEYADRPRDVELQLKSGDVYAYYGDGFRVLSNDELPHGVAWGCHYESYCVNAPEYCKWLLQQIRAQGGSVLRRELRDVNEAFCSASELGFGSASAIINCSGRGFGDDDQTYPIRGQTVLVRQQYHKTITRQTKDGAYVFLIPRPNAGGTIVGGTKEPNDWEPRVRAQTRQMLLMRAAECFPDFVDEVDDFIVVRDNVGRRPARKGGVRAEIEELGNGRRAVHGYGLGGRGYELSWGMAARLCEMLDGCRQLRASL